MKVRAFLNEKMEYSSNFKVKEDKMNNTSYVLVTDSGKNVICSDRINTVMPRLFFTDKEQEVYEYDVVDFVEKGNSRTGIIRYSETYLNYGIISGNKRYPIALAKTARVIGNVFEFPFLLDMCRKENEVYE